MRQKWHLTDVKTCHVIMLLQCYFGSLSWSKYVNGIWETLSLKHLDLLQSATAGQLNGLKWGDVIITECSTSTVQWSKPQGYCLWKYIKCRLYRPWHIISSLQSDTYSALFPSECTQAVLMKLLHERATFSLCVFYTLFLSLSLSLSMSGSSETSGLYQC